MANAHDQGWDACRRRIWLAVQVCAWLWFLPLQLWREPLTEILGRIHRAERLYPPCGARQVEQIVCTVQRVCRLRLFNLRLFPRPCLRLSLALYRFLSPMGYPVRLHIGVRKDGALLVAHSWVTVDDRPLLGGTATEFRTLYSYPDR